jgi:predicted nucleic acid-binding protein
VLFAGAASPSEHSASLVVLRMAEITLIHALASEQVITEATRNLATYLPAAVPTLEQIISRCLHVVADPQPEDLLQYRGRADQKDLPIVVAALREGCSWLVTFNVRHYQPDHESIKVVRPGEFVQHVRGLLAHLAADRE